MDIQNILDWVNSGGIDQELLFMAFILITTMLIVRTLGFVFKIGRAHV